MTRLVISEVFLILEHISEQELFKLIKKLELSQNEGNEVSNKSESSEPQRIGDEGETVDGYIQIEQGKIYVTNPSAGGQFPTIYAQYPIKLYIDEQEVQMPTKVSPESLITWKVEEKPLFEITISEDKLEASLIINRSQRHPWILHDLDRSLHVTMTAEEDRSRILETINLQDVLNAIDHLHINTNLDIPAIQNEIDEPTFESVVIAKGKAPTEGQDARLELYFSEHIENIFHEVDGKVDYKNHLNIPSVKNGDVIARKLPSIEGLPGYDVFGNILLPEPVNDIRIAGKNHVEITSDSTVIARREGRPRVTGSKIKFFDINTAFVVAGNVDLSTGNIVFAGDVIVYGDVMDNMIIETLGNIYVSGSVYNATLTATGSIAIQGVAIGSNIYSGYFGVLYNRFYHAGTMLQDMIEKMMDSAAMLMEEVHKKKVQVSYGQVLMLLTESKYQHVWETVKELLSVITSLQFYQKEKSLHKIKDYLEMFLKPLSIVNTISPSKLGDFLRILRDAVMWVALSQESHVEISISQCQGSTLKSNGDILVRKEGVIQSDLYSTGSILFHSEDSVCRGAKLEAGKRISAKYVGGITGVNTTLKAAEKVSIKEMFGGRICVGRYCIDIFEPIQDRLFDVNEMK